MTPLPTPVYTVLARPRGKWILLTVPEFEIMTEAVTWDEVEWAARDAIATMTECDPDSFQVMVVPV